MRTRRMHYSLLLALGPAVLLRSEAAPLSSPTRPNRAKFNTTREIHGAITIWARELNYSLLRLSQLRPLTNRRPPGSNRTQLFDADHHHVRAGRAFHLSTEN